EKRPVSVRANTLKETPYIDGVNENTDMGDIEKGLFFVQGLSSQKAVKELNAQEGMTVVDLCACPGGKSFGAAIDMQNKGRIISSDLHKNKLSLIQKGAKKLGITIIETVERDARVTDESLIGVADRVICDVPCSGLGVIGTKPEIRYKNAADFDGLYATQAKILENALLYLKKGGRAVYSTCTINKRENDEIINKVVKNKEGYRLVSEQTILPGNGYDGFYIAVIERD
ncbi:MAG: methyltransferase domain-containing protein, partial [Clostridia bacterium]|nr:methyltransferase domain-containing protein [Clostridia bacterium]